MLTVLVPPSASLIQPADGAGFQAGANVTLEAAASNPGGMVTQVEFFQAGTNVLGVATHAPYSTVWSNVCPRASTH
jgi:chitinase